ncbi:DegT/DnrJ/EryC1/StrS aminotransferase family protein [Paenibacillus sp. J2TS4]|uniref:DegT/DnrJ/EryC1/StrS family aminotransferase n=1 Tax=Paenibacillus sp. J2TS4 TaxID=2807194 RepID=UPI001BCAE6BF|nr:aminotransferase class I/II-fold pyridoxal phosphate-dependent enzyme [Paenibacillus sp. J2TS4]
MSNNQRIYLSPPHIGEFERPFVSEAFDTNWIAPLGPHVNAFEQEMASYAGTQGAVALSSGTAAIHLALRLIGVGEGDLVFCSTLTFVASANPILYQGAKPVFIDSEPGSWNMSPQALERALAEHAAQGKLPKAVVVVNLYGQSADFEPLLAICNEYEVPIIEDAAESLGATYQEKRSGSLGKYGVFSFNGNKIITTSGGGMLVSDDLEALEQARFLATQARDPARHYQHSEMGYNYRLSNVLAGIGRGQLRVLEDRVEARRRVFQAYYDAFSDVEGVQFMPEAAFGRSTRWLTTMTIDRQAHGVSPAELVDALAAQQIEARPVWKPLHLQPLFSGCPYYEHEPGESVSDRLFENGLCLPSGSNLSPEDQYRVVHLVKACLHPVTSAAGNS